MGKNSEEPYLSVVITSRNDDHGGNMLCRMQASINGLLAQLEKHHIDSEVILVDWNTPPDKPLLKDALKWPSRLVYCTVRVLIVPPSIHQRYEYADNIGVNKSVADNCGIRRARGQFILPGAIDLLYPDELMAYIASRNLKGDAMYRVDRCDVNENVLQLNTLQQQLDYCRENIILVKTRPARRQRRWYSRNELPDLHTSGCGDFQLMSRYYWHLLHGYNESDIIQVHDDSNLCYTAYAAGVKEVALVDPIRVYHINHAEKYTDTERWAKLPLENWLSLPFLPAPLNKKIATLYRRMLSLTGYKIRSSMHGVPIPASAELQKMRLDIVTGRRPYIFNDENWGLTQEPLEEFVISTAKWDDKLQSRLIKGKAL